MTYMATCAGGAAAGLPPHAAAAGQQCHCHLKDSSLASAIGLAELAYAARTVSGAYARYWEPT
jgi:ABC-type amino acid transport system permease subunit